MDRGHMLDELEAVILDTHALDVTDRCYAEAVLRWIEVNCPAPQIKPLVWKWYNPPSVWRAGSVIGEYEVDTHGSWTRTRGEVISKVFDGGKAAAQADYEARIRSALTTEGEG